MEASPRSASQISLGWGFIEQVEDLLFGGARARDIQEILIGEFDHLHDALPITCRTFGPPVRCRDEAVGVCELCFQGATDAETAACEVEIDPEGLESTLIDTLEKSTGQHGQTIVAYALAL